MVLVNERDMIMLILWRVRVVEKCLNVVWMVMAELGHAINSRGSVGG